MKRFLLAGATLLALTAAQPAVAQPMPVVNWTGYYVGGNIGAVTLNNQVDHYDAGFGCWWSCSLRFTDNASGVIGGFQVGYNWQTGSIVYGIETDLSLASVRTSRFAFGTDYEQNVDISAIGTLRARVGVLVSPTLLAYLTGGLAYAKVRDHVHDNSDPSVQVWDNNGWLFGWTIGGGVEYAMNPRWTLKLEALYYALQTRTIVFNCPAGYCGSAQNYPVDFKHDGAIVRAGFNVKL